jgi:large subunit ribosomal protein L28
MFLFKLFKKGIEMARRCELVGTGVMSGNNISHSHRKTRRRFLPNLHELTFKSDALGVNITLRITPSTLRTVNKYGNIDAFLVNTRVAKLTDEAKKLRNRVVKALEKKGQLDIVKIKRKVSKKKDTPSKKATKKLAKAKGEVKTEKKAEVKKETKVSKPKKTAAKKTTKTKAKSE